MCVCAESTVYPIFAIEFSRICVVSGELCAWIQCANKIVCSNAIANAKAKDNGPEKEKRPNANQRKQSWYFRLLSTIVVNNGMYLLVFGTSKSLDSRRHMHHKINKMLWRFSRTFPQRCCIHSTHTHARSCRQMHFGGAAPNLEIVSFLNLWTWILVRFAPNVCAVCVNTVKCVRTSLVGTRNYSQLNQSAEPSRKCAWYHFHLQTQFNYVFLFNRN